MGRQGAACLTRETGIVAILHAAKAGPVADFLPRGARDAAALSAGDAGMAGQVVNGDSHVFRSPPRKAAPERARHGRLTSAAAGQARGMLPAAHRTGRFRAAGRCGGTRKRPGAPPMRSPDRLRRPARGSCRGPQEAQRGPNAEARQRGSFRAPSRLAGAGDGRLRTAGIRRRRASRGLPKGFAPEHETMRPGLRRPRGPRPVRTSRRRTRGASLCSALLESPADWPTGVARRARDLLYSG